MKRAGRAFSEAGAVCAEKVRQATLSGAGRSGMRRKMPGNSSVAAGARTAFWGEPIRRIRRKVRYRRRRADAGPLSSRWPSISSARPVRQAGGQIRRRSPGCRQRQVDGASAKPGPAGADDRDATEAVHAQPSRTQVWMASHSLRSGVEVRASGPCSRRGGFRVEQGAVDGGHDEAGCCARRFTAGRLAKACS